MPADRHHSKEPDNDDIVYCPQCKKPFASETNVLRHLNNRRNMKCNPWIKELMQLTTTGQPGAAAYQKQYAEAMGRPYVAPRATDTGSSASAGDREDSDVPVGMDMDDRDESAMEWDTQTDSHDSYTDTFVQDISSHTSANAPFRTQQKPVSNTFWEEKYNGAARVYGVGPTIMDEFNQDQYAHQRRSNLYYPFASQAEWEFSLFLIRSSLSMAELNAFLRIPLVSRLNLSYRTAEDLRGRVEMLPAGPQWHVIPITVNGFPTKKPIRLFYRDPLECIKAMFSNPLLAGRLQLTPTKLWKDETRRKRVYREWMTGNTAWTMQEALPAGGTLLGTILTSDKTNISVLSGDRVAHPLLLSLANIETNVLMKATAFFFQLLALIPCPKFLCHKDLRGVAETRLLHACIDHVCKPLKVAALVGAYMPDPAGDMRWCFTPLAAYIVDTPEAAALAGVGGKTSHVTMASWKQFGDSYQHEIRSGSTTLAQIAEVASRISPFHVDEFTKECKKKYRLNGIHEPFWRDWPLSRDPARFLTPEPLHHWHKFFFDHDLKWACAIIGGAEMDFRFAILQPRVGYRHFSEGVSKLKQCTGREHREMQRHIVAIVADAGPKALTICLRALMDFRYIGQSRTIDSDMHTSLQAALAEFHQYKDELLDAGARSHLKKGANWYIPKLEFMQSVAGSIIESGVPMQWSADPTEKAHHTYIKAPARERSNNQDYDPQIVRHLDRSEKARAFDLTTRIHESGINLRQFLHDVGDDIVGNPSQQRAIRNLFRDAEQHAKAETMQSDRIFATSETAFCLNYHPDIRSITVDAAAEKFGIQDLRPALRDFLFSDGLHHSMGGRRQGRSDSVLPFTHLQVWFSVRVQTKPVDDAVELKSPDLLLAEPPSTDWPQGRYDCALFSVPSSLTEQPEWPPKPTILSNHAAAQLRIILRPIQSGSENPFLVYALRFDPTRSTPDPITGMYPMKRALRADQSRLGGILRLSLLRMPVDVAPRLGRNADRRLSKTNIMDVCNEFWLNKYWHKDYYNLF